ncbi:hypothetical protein niasHT_020466 [Heterodera trifolii]|uniref:Uncharacterized protein n=1 Tax=Heterodera trifolii TaxID=157864 RepID=A0ABD2JGI3_9BILA
MVSALLDERRADRDGCTPLLCAVKRNADANGDMLLHHVVMADSVPIVKLLLCFGAYLDVRNNSRKTASDVPNIDKKSVASVLRERRGHAKLALPNWHDAALSRLRREQQRRAMDYQRERRAAKDKGSGDVLRLLSLDGDGTRGLVIIQERHRRKGQTRNDGFCSNLSVWRMAGTTQKREKQKRQFCPAPFRFYSRDKHWGDSFLPPQRTPAKSQSIWCFSAIMTVLLSLPQNMCMTEFAFGKQRVVRVPHQPQLVFTNQVTNFDGAAVELARTICHDKKIPFFRITPQLRDEG